jgi:integrase
MLNSTQTTSAILGHPKKNHREVNDSAELLTIKDVAQLLRVPVSWVYDRTRDRGYLDGNAAHGIRIRSMGVKPKPRFYSPTQVQKLLPELSAPCRAVVQVAVLTGMRIGEILALRWKRVDFLRKTLEVAETFFRWRFRHPKNEQQQSCSTHQFESLRSAGSASFRPEIVWAR